MAKKVVATLQKGGGKGYTKAIKMARSQKTGAYMFQEKMVLKELYLLARQPYTKIILIFRLPRLIM